MISKQAKYNIGDCVIHLNQHYRGVIIDIDPLFQASGRYNPQALTRAFASRNPWYRILVDNSSQITYVEECYLQADLTYEQITHPLINQFLSHKQGQYHSKIARH